MSLFKSKKAGIGADDMMTALTTIIILLLLMGIFWWVMYQAEAEVELKASEDIHIDETNYKLHYFLRTPVEIDNKNVADLIADFVDYSKETGNKYVDDKLVYSENRDPFLKIVKEEDSRAKLLGVIITKLREISFSEGESLKNKVFDCEFGKKCYSALIVTYNGGGIIYYKPINGPSYSEAKAVIPSHGSGIIEVEIMSIGVTEQAYKSLEAYQSSVARKSTPTSRKTLYYDWGNTLDYGAIEESRDEFWEGWKREDLTYILEDLSSDDLMAIVDAYNNRKLLRKIGVDKIKNPKEDLKKWFSELDPLLKGFNIMKEDPRTFRELAKKYYEDWEKLPEE